MININLAGAIYQSTQLQRTLSAEKDRQLRKQVELEKNIALQDDQLDHFVESAEEVRPIRRENEDDHPRRNKDDAHHPSTDDRDDSASNQSDEPPALDLTA